MRVLPGFEPLLPLAQGQGFAAPGTVADGHIGKPLSSGEGDPVFLKNGVIEQEAALHGKAFPHFLAAEGRLLGHGKNSFRAYWAPALENRSREKRHLFLPERISYCSGAREYCQGESFGFSVKNTGLALRFIFFDCAYAQK